MELEKRSVKQTRQGDETTTKDSWQAPNAECLAVVLSVIQSMNQSQFPANPVQYSIIVRRMADENQSKGSERGEMGDRWWLEAMDA